MCSGCQKGEGRPVGKLERQRGKKKPKGKLGERGAASCVKENGVGAAAALVWFPKEGEQRRGQGDGVGLGKENDGGTGCEIGGLCRRLKRKNLQNQRREGGGGSP